MSSTNFKRLEDIGKSLFDYSSPKRCHHFSFILYKNRIIAIGENNKKTHPINLKNPKSNKDGVDFSDQKYTCSEFNAILKLKRLTNIDSKKCILINIRFDRNKNIALARPCTGCINLLRYFLFKKIVFTDEAGKYVELRI